MWRVFKLAARAAVWRATPEPPLVGLPALLGWTFVLAALRVALQFLSAGALATFNPYGLNAVVAWLAFELAVAALLVRPAGRVTALSAMFVLSIFAEIGLAAIKVGHALLASNAVAGAFWTSAAALNAVFAVEAVWWFGAMLCVLRSVEPQPRMRLMARVAALWAALFVANMLVPHAPVFVPRNFDVRTANWWEILHARFFAGTGPQSPEDAGARLAQSQNALLQAEVARLAPQRAGVTDIYAIGIAGWAEDVFIKELDGALASIASVLPIRDRTLRLVNHRETAASIPLANQRNFAAAVHAVGAVMDKDEDVLVLLMTSHGDDHGFALQLPGNVMTELTPQEVASTLDSEGIKNRVVIVSACYSGIFVPPLANDDTFVLTAADAKNTSFGCAPERDWTYFGDALFRQSVRPGADFKSAFEHARVLIQGWELMDRVKASNPQGHFGPALDARLAPVFQSATRAGP